MKRLGGNGRSGTNIRKMEYKGNTASTEVGIANLMADSAQDTFKPLDDPNFDYHYFQNLSNEWEDAQDALELHKNNGMLNADLAQQDNFTWNPESSTLKNRKLIDTDGNNPPP